MLLTEKYHPLTAAPFRRNRSYRELAPCAALRPYIRCFWGSDGAAGAAGGNSLVIPDTCTDILFFRDAPPVYCGLDERAHAAGADENGIFFAIRFYGWTAVYFADRDLSRTKNRAVPAEEYFGRLLGGFGERLPYAATLGERAALAERALLARLDPARESADLLNAVFLMLDGAGRTRIAELSRRTAVSEKTLERLFLAHTGLSPKSFSSLLRYQLLWREVLSSPDFSALGAVEKFGYADQAHLLNDFRKYHGMTPREARDFAFKNKF